MGGHLGPPPTKVSGHEHSHPYLFTTIDSYHYSAPTATRFIQAWCTIRQKRSRKTQTHFEHTSKLLWLAHLIVLSGDIETNPGLRSLKYPCGDCGKSVTTHQKGVACETRDIWYHTKCMGIRDVIYGNMGNSSWHCLECALPNVSVFQGNQTDPTSPTDMTAYVGYQSQWTVSTLSTTSGH